MTRETSLRQRLSDGAPDIVVDLHLYPEADGGKTKPVGIGWGCPCSKDKSLTEVWDGDRDHVRTEAITDAILAKMRPKPASPDMAPTAT